MRKTLIQILHHDIGLVQNQVPVYQGWQGVVRIQIRQFRRRVIRIHIHDINSDTFLSQDNTHPMTVVACGIREKSH